MALAGRLQNNGATANPGTISGGAFSVSPTLTKGYFVLVPGWPSNGGPVSIGYQTDPYVCPYSSSFRDIHGTFKGCFFGYLSQDQAHKCGARQYFLNGSCLDVDPSCNTFNPLNGNCLTCWPNSRRTNNGLCSTIIYQTPVPSCLPGTHLFQNLCIPDACLAALPNGVCTACVNTAYKLTSSGSCIEIDCSIGLYFSVALDQCVFLPPRCLAFNVLTQKCTKCFDGFFPNN